jgi:para-aminobenzoate synthetase/4-amino-4-deoxychorismate lyase
MLVVDGRLVELDAHLSRLESSLAELFPDRTALDPRTEIERRAAGLELGSIRATAAPVGAAGLRTQIELRRGAFPSDSEGNAPRPIALCSLILAGGLGAHKWADRSLLEEAQALLPAETLPLILDRDGTVLEASRANVFAVRGGDLLTPPTDGRILPGVTRARVLEMAAATGMAAHEVELSRDDLLNADEVFLTGSVRGVERARSLDGVALDTAGEVGSALEAELRQAWAAAQVG